MTKTLHAGQKVRPIELAADLVVQHVRQLIVERRVSKGDRLPTERELVRELGVSRTSIRAGLQALAAKGVVVSRRGAGTFIAAGPPVLDTEALGLFTALHGVSRQEMFEARRTLEVRVAGMAAKRARTEDLAAIADSVTDMFAALGDPQEFLVCDIQFHRRVGAASGNKILSSMVELVSTLFYERRRRTADRQRDLRGVADMHRQIYQAIRDRNEALAERLMNDHLLEAQRAQEAEGPDNGVLPAGGHEDVFGPARLDDPLDVIS
jgi:GntR family transcriptional repressor for pyruvate dehydrogenase complex